MNKLEILIMLSVIFYITSNSAALKCYVCRTKEISECHDLRNTYLKPKECFGTLKWNEKFACFVNSSMVNNLIETDRNCMIINSLSEPCLGKTSANKFGTCRVCYEDECNNENNNIENSHNEKLKACWITIVSMLLAFRLF